MLRDRAGSFIKQREDYNAFIPKPLPPDPPLNMGDELIDLLSQADRSLGRLDGISQILPNPDLFVAMYVKKEAVLSSQIEGTQASLIDVLDVGDTKEKKERPIKEVVKYVKAINYGLERLKEFPICLRLIREIHEVLLDGVRGGERNPGEFRKSQNWIGPSGCTLARATFVPPPVPEMLKAMGELENFIHNEELRIPALIKIGLIHAQFETIHPFLDGNGRIGRLLITFWLCYEKILSKPLLYLSYYFKMNRTEYYDRLMDVRLKGDWESWIKFFLRGIAQVSDESIETAKKILKLKEEHTRLINEKTRNPANGLKLLEKLFEQPIITITMVADMVGVSYPTANNLVGEFNELGLIKQVDHTQRNKRFSYHEYVELLQEGTELPV